jgi:Tol biopolymer transport system component/DNA-binding winged helix-turn-helix (wHTH) protein
LPAARYAFGPFVVDTRRRILWRDGDVVSITAKTFDVLLVLLECRTRTVPKEELFRLVWPNTVVHENNLARQVSSLRRALGQRSDQHDYIVTIPGEGYRFVGTLDRLPDVSPAVDIGLANGALPGHENRASTPSEPDSQRAAAAAPHERTLLPVGAAVIALAGIVVAGVAGLLGSRYGQTSPSRVLERVTYDEAALARDPAWSPDGRSVIYVSNRGGSADLWKQHIGSPDAERLTMSHYDETQPAWSPDGQWIVFRSERAGGGLYMMPAGGGPPRPVSPFGYEPRWSPDGTHILFKRSTVLPNLPSVYVVGLDGRPPRPLRPDVLGRFTTLQTAWHPDGRRVSVWGAIGRTEQAFLTVPLSGGEATASAIADDVERGLANLSPGRFAWAPSGRFIYFEAVTGDTQNVWRVTVDPRTGTWGDGPEPLTTGPTDATDVAISPDGTRLLLTTTSTRTRLWAFPFDVRGGRLTGEPYPVTDGSTGEVDFDVRDDGSMLVYRTVRAGRDELWERSIVAGKQRLLLSTPDERLMKPRWSPDGAQLAFSRHGARDDGLAVAVLNRDGTGERVVTNPAEFDMQASDWSADGRAILGACTFRGAERAATCLVPLSGGAASGDAARVRVIASDPARNLYNQRFSPDQRWISFLAHDLWHASTSTVYAVPTTGGSWIPITEGAWFDDKPTWSPDGRALYFISNRTGVANVWGRRFDPVRGTPIGDSFPVTSFTSPRFALTTRTVQMDIGVTATHLLLPMSESRSDIWMLDLVDR